MQSEQKISSWRARPHGFGGLILLSFLAQLVSGLYLALFYQPSPAEAWKSVTLIGEEVWLGGFFFSLHRWGALLLALLIIFHILHMLWRGAYKNKRALTWLSGLPLLLPAVLFILSGFMLPWDFRAYWATLTMENWLDRLPLFSSFLSLLLSPEPGGGSPVARWFVLHSIFLPLVTVAGLGLHALAMRRHDPLRNAGAKNLVAAGALLLGLCLLAIFGVYKPDFADPVTTLAIPQPDWLFFIFFQATRYLQGSLEMIGVFWIPLGLVLGLCFVPCAGRLARAGWPMFMIGLAFFVGLSVFTYRSGSTTPAWSCPSCHKESFGESFSHPPELVSKYSKRYDNKWLALHYRYPQYFWMMDADVPGW